MKPFLIFFLTVSGLIHPVFGQEKNPNALTDLYFFNKQIFFTVKYEGHVVSSYFYLNTKKGYSLLDKDFFEKTAPQNAVEAHITFPKYKEYFLYYKEPYSRNKISRISHTSIPVGPKFLEDPEELLRYFKDWFSGPSADLEFWGENHNLKSESYTASYEEGDVSLYLSKQTTTEIQDNYCIGWLGLGYLNVNGDYTAVITRTLSVSGNYQIDFLQEKDVNFTLDGKEYSPVQAKINVETDKLDEALVKEKVETDTRIARTDDVTQKDLELKLQKAKEKKMNAASAKIKDLAQAQGKTKDFYDTYNKTIADPSDDIDVMLAEADLKIYKTNKKISKTKDSKALQKLQAELTAQKKMKDKLSGYKKEFQLQKEKYHNNSKKLMEENKKLFTQMIVDLQSN